MRMIKQGMYAAIASAGLLSAVLATPAMASAASPAVTRAAVVQSPSGHTYRTTGNVNLRKGPTTDWAIFTTIKRGTALNLRCYVEGQRVKGTTTWYYTTYRGKTGYVSGAYLAIRTGKAAPRCPWA